MNYFPSDRAVCRCWDCNAVNKDGEHVSVGLLIKLLVYIHVQLKICYSKKMFGIMLKHISHSTKSCEYLFHLDFNPCKHWAKTMFACVSIL